MVSDFLTRLQSEVLILYAPMQTLLMNWGKELECHLSEWIMSHPEAYQDALVKSYAAGCDMGSTSTQASSIFRCKPYHLEGRVHEFNYKSARLAREVTPQGRYVLGIISVSNPDFLEPVGSYTKGYLISGYAQQIMALAEGGVDAFHIAGMQIDTLCLAVKVAKEKTDLPVIAQSHIYKDVKGFHTLYGNDPKMAGQMLTEAGADVVGCMCGLFSYEETADIVRQMRSGTRAILGAQPDAGKPILIDGETVHPATPEEMAANVPDWIKAGAKLVGGCCGTTLEHYAQLSAQVKQFDLKGA